MRPPTWPCGREPRSFYVAQHETLERLRMNEAVGNRVPAHCTALGKALLSILSEE